jgi:site-specific recombinase XerD
MKYDKLKKDTKIKLWLSRIGAKPNTVKSYILGMQEYTEFTKMTPYGLILKAEADIKAGKLMRERIMTLLITEYREFLEQKGLAPMTIKGKMTAVCSFYKTNQIDLPVLPRCVFKARAQKKRRTIPTKEDIQEILKHADILERAIILVGVSSGLAVNEIANLKIGEYHEGNDEKTKITTLHLVREKVDYEFITCLSPEATKAVDDYLAYRERKTTTYRENREHQLEKQRIVSDEGYLFIKRNISDKYLTYKHDKKKTKAQNDKIRENMRKIDTESIITMYRRLNEEAQKSTPAGEWNVIRSHTMRKYFNSTMLNAGASMFLVDYCMGHQLDATHETYFQGQPQKVRERYSEYVHHLIIQKEPDEAVLKKYEEEVKRNKELEADAIKLAVERTEVQKMKEELEGMKKSFHDFIADKPPITKEFLDSVLRGDTQENKLKNKK